MVPVAGSAYTYAYATLGELVAWIIGWDLLLEYAIGNTAVAISWAGYVDALLRGLGVDLPRWLVTDYRTAAQTRRASSPSAPHVLGVPDRLQRARDGHRGGWSPIVLVWGVKESARFNAVMVARQAGRPGVLRPRRARASCAPTNWHPFAPNGFAGVGAGRGRHLLRVHRLRRRLDVRRGVQEPRPRHAHRHPRLARRVHGHLRGRRRASSRGSCRTRRSSKLDPARRAEALAVAMEYVAMPSWTVGVVALGSVVAQTAVLLVFQLGQPRILFAMARDGLLPPVFARVHPRVQDAARLDHPHRRARRRW